MPEEILPKEFRSKRMFGRHYSLNRFNGADFDDLLGLMSSLNVP